MGDDKTNPWIDLSGRIALVTGAASGIGRAASIALAGAGATLLAADIDDRAVAETVGEIEQAGGTAHARRLDVTEQADWDALRQWTKETFGRLDILVNSAGIVMGDHIGDSTEVYRRIFAVNVEGTLHGMAMALDLMREQGSGAIVNMASSASFRGSQVMASYGASKAAVAHFTRTAALETVRGGTGIRVNSIHPGLTETSMADDLYEIYGDSASREQIIARATTGRVARPEEVADLILFLASDRSSYISGANIPIDNALTA